METQETQKRAVELYYDKYDERNPRQAGWVLRDEDGHTETMDCGALADETEAMAEAIAQWGATDITIVDFRTGAVILPAVHLNQPWVPTHRWHAEGVDLMAIADGGSAVPDETGDSDGSVGLYSAGELALDAWPALRELVDGTIVDTMNDNKDMSYAVGKKAIFRKVK